MSNRNKVRATISLIVLLINTTLVAQSEANFHNVKTDHIEVSDLNRSYSYYIPKGVTQNPKLVFVLHGSGMDTKTMIQATGFEFNRVADSLKNMIIVYPQGYEKAWNDCRKSVSDKAHTLHLNEMKFFKKIISNIESKNKIKPSSMFVVGFSNGGQLVYKLAKENPGFFKGFSAIGATLPIASNDNCVAKNRAVSILVANGTEDPVSPFNGGQETIDGVKKGEVIPTFNSIEYFKDLMACSKTIETKNELPGINVYKNYCNNSNKIVELVKINGGGHVIPNPHFSKWPKSLGKVNQDINLPKFILDFFESIK